MRIIGVQSRVSPFLIAVVLLLQLSPALATGQPDAQQATTKGAARRSHLHEVANRWASAPAGVRRRGHSLQGFVGGDLGDGDFVGEVLDRKVSTPCTAFDPPCTPGITPPTITGSIACAARDL